MSGGLEVTGLVVRGPGAGPTDGPDPGEVDLELRPGELVALSTLDAVDASVLLGALAGLRPTYAGTVLLDGEPLLSRDGSAPPVRLGYVGPDHLLLGTLTAVENLAVVLLGTGASAAEVVARATAQLDAVGLPPSSWHNLVEQLSGGQQQRVAVARALIARPRLLLLDDPTSELDPASAELVALALGEAAAAGAVVVVSTDDPVLLDVCDEVTLDGQVTPTYAPRRALL